MPIGTHSACVVCILQEKRVKGPLTYLTMHFGILRPTGCYSESDIHMQLLCVGVCEYVCICM